MSEKNLNITVSDFSVYPQRIPASGNVTHKSVIQKLKKLFNHISSYDFWISEHNKKIRERIKQRNSRRLNYTKSISYKLSAPTYKNCNTNFICK